MSDTLADARLQEFLRELPEASREEITQFRGLVERYFLGELTPDEFKARRLHMGTYGIRGVKDLHMMRIKIPEGLLNAEQLECLAELAERYSKGIGHITTRQDMQLYWIPTKEAAACMVRASAAGLTTREACGNSVRNVTACPFAGISPTELFDVTKHADAVTRHFLRNPASQKLPRKFKIAFEGCPVDHAKTAIHDIGAVAAIQHEGGKRILGFRLYVGGGLGAAPMPAILLEPFTPATELLRTCEAVVRVHDRLGDRKNKATARIKFVVKRLGPEPFRKEVFAERERLPRYAYADMDVTETDEQPPTEAGTPTPGGVADGSAETRSVRPTEPGHPAKVRWRGRPTEVSRGAVHRPIPQGIPAAPAVSPGIGPRPSAVGRMVAQEPSGGRDVAPIGAGVQVPRALPEGLHGLFTRWAVTNVLEQKQRGFSTVTIRLRLGDISTPQMRSLATIVRRYCGGRLRTTIDQNLALRWVRSEHLASLYRELDAIGLAEPEAGKLFDVTSCPGAETCQLGISASRGLARAMEAKFKEAGLAGEDIENVRIKVSGCPNSCGQHHIADIGFFGGARKVNERLAPHFQLLLGGLAEEGKAEFGQPVLKLPSRRIPDAAVRMLELYRQGRRSPQESFRVFAARVGPGYWKQALEPFTTLPPYETSPEAYRDWGAETDFSLGGMGPGECAA